MYASSNCPRCNALVRTSDLHCGKCKIKLRRKKSKKLIAAERTLARLEAKGIHDERTARARTAVYKEQLYNTL